MRKENQANRISVFQKITLTVKVCVKRAKFGKKRQESFSVRHHQTRPRPAIGSALHGVHSLFARIVWIRKRRNFRFVCHHQGKQIVVVDATRAFRLCQLPFVIFLELSFILIVFQGWDCSAAAYALCLIFLLH